MAIKHLFFFKPFLVLAGTPKILPEVFGGCPDPAGCIQGYYFRPRPHSFRRFQFSTDYLQSFEAINSDLILI